MAQMELAYDFKQLLSMFQDFKAHMVFLSEQIGYLSSKRSFLKRPKWKLWN